ncbi:MAG: FmdB family zinc ribbon protein, partial [Candidatus Limnocylindrales bacterium]
MPIYDYVCGACGHRLEVIHGLHDHGPVECPNCHARAMRKAISAPAVVFKGSGWAKKDRGNAASTRAAAKAAGDGPSTTPGDGSGTPSEARTSTREGSTASRDGATASRDGATASRDG